MKQIRKQIGSLLLSACMVFTMLPTVAFAEEGVQNSGTSSSTSEITAFANLAEDVALQEVETGTTLEELNLPSTLTVTVTTVTTGTAMTATESGDDVATDSEAQETEAQEEETTIEVSDWAADPDYDGETAGNYTFTPTLTIPEGITLADGVTVPQITVTVEETAVPILQGAEMQLLGTGTDTDITAKFTDANFLAAVYAKIEKTAPEAIYDTDVSGITSLNVREMSIESLAGIEYFTGLTELYCFFNKLTALDVSSNTSLTTLNFSGNQLTTLDVSNNTALTYLDCSNNQLTTLDVSKNTALTNLYCYNNKLTTLNVSKNTALKSLRCDENYMPDKSSVTGLDTDLTTDFIYEPQKETYAITVNNGTANLSKGAPGATVTITANTPDNGKAFREWKVVSGGVTLSSNTSATTTFTMPSCKVEVTAIYDTDITDKFTDVNFLAAVRHALGIEADASIYKTDVSGITFLNVPGKKITSLDGIEYFTALTRLDCYDNQLTALDISNNTKLTNLSCEYNQLTDLNLSNNTALTILYCQRNQLTNLKVSNNTALKKLYCQSNQLTKLDLSNNTALTTLNCSWNQLTALDVSKNTALTNLYCYDNQLTVLNISSNTALTTLDCSINYLSALNVDKNKALKNLYCGSNPLTGLTVSSNTALTSLACSSNHLTALDVSLNTALTSLDCSQNQLTVLIVSNNTALTSLNCNSNHLTELDVSSNTKLTSLNCAYNNMTGESSVTGLDKDLTTDLTLAPQNTSSPISTDITDKFTDPDFLAFVRKLLGNSSDASIYDTDVSGITSLDVSGNGIASLAGIDSFISLKYLYCSDNQLTVLNISSNTALKSLECGNNPLTYLDVSKNTALERLDCYENQLTKLDVSKNTALINLSCYENQLTKLDVSKNTALTNLLCYSNQLTALDVSSNTKLTQMRCYDNYMTDESAVVGLDKKLTKLFKFAPQNTVPSTYTITVNSGTANLSIAAENAT